ncbi:GNAT family N-acetyltransferase [Hoyosella rhizosphaerae]|uniref:GNAT family N-acetyltransferase n=1 Tax=Hoyosella rhizosphaerae TaxID=1755582 RepID=UPI001E59FD56|nr:GNAT family N-acetyltransferase [Hoyosella rhizosphaerae]
MTDLSPSQLRERLNEALSIYVAAMGYPPSVARRRAPMWAEHALRRGWKATGAFTSGVEALTHFGPQTRQPRENPSNALVGIAYGYSGDSQQWWYQQVRNGICDVRGVAAADVELEDYFELTELHIHPLVQGRNLGQSLLLQLLNGVDHKRVLLSTPEIAGESNRAWRLYRRLGFDDVLRNFRFDGDPRPFAILGRSLPVQPLECSTP